MRRAVDFMVLTLTNHSTLLRHSFYAITDKGTSWLSPLLIGIINQATGDFRIAFVSLVAFMIIPLPILHFVRVPEGMKEAQDYYEQKVLRKQLLSPISSDAESIPSSPSIEGGDSPRIEPQQRLDSIDGDDEEKRPIRNDSSSSSSDSSQQEEESEESEASSS
jgi:hypothetical protein